jgi:hypothetical protein
MPQQIDVRDHRKCNDHDSLSISQHGSRRIVTMSLRQLCRNVDVSPDKQQADNLGFRIRLDMRPRQSAKKVRDQDRSIQDGPLSADQAPMKPLA